MTKIGNRISSNAWVRSISLGLLFFKERMTRFSKRTKPAVLRFKSHVMITRSCVVLEKGE